jgi:hypothetical protein
VVAVIKSNAYKNSALARRYGDRLEFAGEPACWLFHQNMAACGNRCGGDFGERIMQRRDHDHVAFYFREHFAPICERYAALV